MATNTKLIHLRGDLCNGINMSLYGSKTYFVTIGLPISVLVYFSALFSFVLIEHMRNN